MWPWGHLAVGYLCYAALLRIRDDGTQRLSTLTAVVIGSQFPDLVDKPLAWTFSVLPSGRSLAHSLLTAAVVLTVLYWVTEEWQHREEAFAFGIGYLSHSLSDLGPDVVWGLLQGDWSQLEWTTYLLWPMVQAPPYPHDSSFVRHITGFVVDSYVLFQFVLFGVAIAVWLTSGAPGLAAARRDIRAWLERGVSFGYFE